ncbi:hypothetical protein [Alloyangia pacifica]|uniref:hypothetical protein n=1 Tax=Alloyangia pacifica TaxID=311180 RepID=UPI0031D42D0A
MIPHPWFVTEDSAHSHAGGLAALAEFSARMQPVIYARSWHLVPDVQNRSILEGYDQAREDALLAATAVMEHFTSALFGKIKTALTSARGSSTRSTAGSPRTCR